MAVNSMRGLFSTSIIGNIFHPYLRERLIHFSKWNLCSACSFQCFLGGFTGRTQINSQLSAEKRCPFCSSPRFQKAKKMNWKKFCQKKIFDSFSIKTLKIKIVVFNIARNLNLEFELWLLAVLCSVVAWSISYSASDGIFENISLWFLLFIIL